MKDQSLLPKALPHGAQWAIEETAAMQLLTLLQSTNAETHEKEFAARGGASSIEREGYDIVQGVGIIRISGAMMKSPSSLSSSVSTVYTRRAVRAAMNDKEVDSILLVIDSPGGSVSGTADLASDIAMASGKKPCFAYVEDMCCSAAYWIASQTQGILANQTAMIGSIGTYMVLVDGSRMHENLGVSVHVLSTGKLKGAGQWGAKITDEQLESFQKTVDDLNQHFLTAVSRGRNMPMDSLMQLADGSVWIGSEAVSKGLVDDICTFDEAFYYAKRQGQSSGARAEDRRTLAADGTTFVLTDNHEVRQIGDELLIATKETISREDGPLAELTLAEETDSALAAVRGLTDRLANLKATRDKDNRSLSEKARGHITDAIDCVTACAATLNGLIADEDPVAIAALSNAIAGAELAIALST